MSKQRPSVKRLRRRRLERWANTLVYQFDSERRPMTTVSMLGIDHSDLWVDHTKHFVLNIRHCRQFVAHRDQQGFMCNVSGKSGYSTSNGYVHFGTNLIAYKAALADGRAMLAERQQEFDDDMRRIIRLERMRRNKTA